MAACCSEGWEPKNADVLCSEQFEATCFDRTGQTTRLRPGSIPTIFPAFPAHLQKPAKRKREAPKCRTALSPVVSAEAAVEMTSEPSSPVMDWYRSKAEESAQEVLQLKKKVKTLQQSKRRLSKWCDASENLIKELKERKLLSEKGLEVFEATFSPEIQQLLVRAHEKTNKMYPPELRAFALTLHYYSAAAYEYVRSKFNNALPSQRTLREWYKSVNGDPGFTSEAFDFIKNLAKSQDKPLIAALMMDDMAIKKHVQLVGKKAVGYIDLGTGISDDSLPEATNVCVFMLVGMNMRLKIPLGYFFIESLSGSERAALSELEPHLLDCDPLDNHIYVLAKKIANLYITIRLHLISKEINRKNSRSGVRTQLTRTIIIKKSDGSSSSPGYCREEEEYVPQWVTPLARGAKRERFSPRAVIPESVAAARVLHQ
ncbi:hypothetical protein HPB51_018808 [Rhipicephalus microplus]|uniref:THAP-type domain-containing protein n=1 Tax=Rhipicephalus microplus TaxID=6941 RepID=A0A9J6DB69_RHIMP|nr:hypothetical protein HPB51_018808 [Rhipicephalus microplus]